MGPERRVPITSPDPPNPEISYRCELVANPPFYLTGARAHQNPLPTSSSQRSYRISGPVPPKAGDE
ncbi:hypothetical protein Scep_014871 [Stephania cephalantha]|uniref:Uncharacterized protein n=1 Tax=Stephania cephalantha TaxID=152367 RepID=A0AAP0P282_9MAGN